MRFLSLLMTVALISLLTFCSPNTGSEVTYLSETEIDLQTNAFHHNLGYVPNDGPLNVPYETVTVPAKEAYTATFEGGTIVHIPANAFVDANGAPVTEAVELAYREVLQPSEIIGAGIPMCVKQADGSIEWMQTAGMFEMKGQSQGQEVFIAPDKEISIDLASPVDGEYGFWEYDETAKNWILTGTSLPTAAEAPQQVSTSPEVVAQRAAKAGIKKPQAPPMPRKGSPALNFDVDYSTFPELKSTQGMVWRYAGTSEKEDPINNQWIFSADWVDADLKAGPQAGSYYLSLYSDSKDYSILVVPDQQTSAYKKMMADYEMAYQKYETELEAYQLSMMSEAQKRAKAQADLERPFRRSLRIASFGFKNCDIFYRIQDAQELFAHFDLNVEDQEDLKNVKVFHISGDNRVVITYPLMESQRLRFDPRDKNTFVAILPNERVAVLTPQAFKEQITGLSGTSPKSPKSLKFSVSDQPITSLDDLDVAL